MGVPHPWPGYHHPDLARGYPIPGWGYPIPGQGTSTLTWLWDPIPGQDTSYPDLAGVSSCPDLTRVPPVLTWLGYPQLDLAWLPPPDGGQTENITSRRTAYAVGKKTNSRTINSKL